jgi:hypothetical protein
MKVDNILLKAMLTLLEAEEFKPYLTKSRLAVLKKYELELFQVIGEALVNATTQLEYGANYKAIDRSYSDAVNRAIMESGDEILQGKISDAKNFVLEKKAIMDDKVKRRFSK